MKGTSLRTRVAVVLVALVIAALVVLLFSGLGDEPAWVSATAAVVSAAFAAITATTGALALAQIRRDSKSSSRPMVAPHFARGSVKGYVDLVVQNFGSSPARELTVRFEPPSRTG